MSKLKVILFIIYFASHCSCDFSDQVNINAIIHNSTLLPNFDVQITSGNTDRFKTELISVLMEIVYKKIKLRKIVIIEAQKKKLRKIKFQSEW